VALKKFFTSPDEAVADIFDGATIMVAGFGTVGVPQELVKALLRKGVKELTCICNACHGRIRTLYDAARLVENGQVRRVITSFPIFPGIDAAVERLWQEGKIEVEVVPQGTLAERIRAGGAGIGAFFTPTGIGTPFAEGKERRIINGRECVLETALRADFALLKAHKADTLGNLVYRRCQRNYNPIMAMAADVTIVEVDEVVEPGEIDPEVVITPGIYVDRIVKVG